MNEGPHIGVWHELKSTKVVNSTKVVRVYVGRHGRGPPNHVRHPLRLEWW